MLQYGRYPTKTTGKKRLVAEHPTLALETGSQTVGVKLRVASMQEEKCLERVNQGPPFHFDHHETKRGDIKGCRAHKMNGCVLTDN